MNTSRRVNLTNITIIFRLLCFNFYAVVAIWRACELFRAFRFWLAYPSVVDLALSSVAAWFTLSVIVLDIAVFWVVLLWEQSLSVRAVDLALIVFLSFVSLVYRLDFAFPAVDLGACFGVAAITTIFDITVFVILFLFVISDSILTFWLTVIISSTNFFITILFGYLFAGPTRLFSTLNTSITFWVGIAIIFSCQFVTNSLSIITNSLTFIFSRTILFWFTIPTFLDLTIFATKCIFFFIRRYKTVIFVC